ncbi:MAG: hypothetical protein JWM41_797 [Gemmatimonadetes bacterium]|nr:hypothetical protein [Gemmatimonadota bacterium]
MDRVATGCSAACAVHCAIMPILIPLLPVAFGRLLGPALEWGFTLTSVALGVTSLGHSYRTVHRDGRPLAGFAVGISILLASKQFAEGLPAIELSAVAAGASLIMASHVLNLRLRRLAHAATECECPCHDA